MTKVVIVRALSVAPEPRVEKIAETLTRNGFEVTVLAWDREGIHPHEERRERYTIHRFNFRAPQGRLIMIPHLLFWWIYVFTYLLRSRCKVIHVCGFNSAVPAILVKTLTRKKLVYDVFDFYADILPLIIPARIRSVIAALERLMLRTSDVVIIVDESRRGELGRLPCPIEVIVNSPKDPIMLGKKTDHRFRIFHAAYLSYNNVRSILQVAKAIRFLPDVSMHIAGWGPASSIIRNLAEKQKNISFLGRIPYSEVMKRTVTADLLFAMYDPRRPITKVASPNKLFEAMAASKPIIVNSGTAMASIVEKAGCGITVPFGDVQALREAVRTLRDNPSLAREMGRRGRKLYEEKFSWDLMERKLIQLYRCIIGA